MKKFLRTAFQMLFVVFVTFGLGFCVGFGYFQYRQMLHSVPVDAGASDSDLRLPGEVEKRLVTQDEVTSKLLEIGQLATYTGEYTVKKSVDHTRFFLDDIPIPGTTNTIHLACSGIVKVGYELEGLTPLVDNDSRKIYIALPKPAVLDNYVIWDTIECTEMNNILNPIDFAQYQTLMDEIERDGLAQAEEQGIYEAAQKNVRLLITNFLAGFEDFEVVFLQ